MKNLIKIFNVISKKDQRKLIILFFLSLIAIFLETLSIAILIPLIAAIVESDNFLFRYLSQFNFENLKVLLLSLTIIFFVAKNLYLILYSYLKVRFLENLRKEYSLNLFEHYLKKNYLFFLKMNTSELFKNTRQEVNSFAIYVDYLLTFMIEFVLTIILISILFFINPINTLIIISLVGIFGLIIFLSSRNKLKKLGQESIETDTLLTKHIMQGFLSAKEIKILNKENELTRQVRDNFTNFSKVSLSYQFISSIPKYLFETIIVVILMSVIIFLIYNGEPSNQIISMASIFAVSAFRIMPATYKILNSLQHMTFRKPSIQLLENEYKEIIIDKNLKQEHKINSFNNKIKFSKLIEIRDLNFAYENTGVSALKNINLKISKGEFIVIVGKSGSGKSTLVNIISGLLKPDNGQTLIDNVPKNLNIKAWQKSIGYVPQSTYLIDDSIKKNIAFGYEEDQIDQNKVLNLVRKLNLEEFINKLPNGLNTKVGEQGISLSGGQRQRVAIARALYNSPELLIFDEPTSSLDLENEKEFFKTLKEIKSNNTILYISHKIDNLDFYDKKVILSDGKIN